MAGLSTPFAHPHCATDASALSPDTQASKAYPQRLGSRSLSSLILDDSFDILLPSAPSLENFLSHMTPGLDGRLNSSTPGRLLTLSGSKSLNGMGSLDLSWLSSEAAAMQRQGSAAECIMGPQPPTDGQLPQAPALRTSMPAPHHQQHSQQQHNTRQQAQAHQAATQAPKNNTNNSSPHTPACSVEQQAQDGLGSWQQQHQQHQPSPFASQAREREAEYAAMMMQHQHQMNFQQAYMAALVGGGGAGGGMNQMQSQLVPTPHSSYSSGLGTYPSNPSCGYSSNNSSSSTAEAMALWSQQKALMQALNGSDIMANAQAVGALTAGADGVPQLQYAPNQYGTQTCPFQVQISDKPALCVAPASPVRLSSPPSPMHPQQQ